MTATLEPATRADRDVVLAVDDNEHNLQLLEEYLGMWGYEVVFARDGAEALQLYARVNPSIIVLDVMMPVMDGYDACARIKEQPGGRTIPILMLTALTGTEEKVKALQCGADEFLNKRRLTDDERARLADHARMGASILAPMKSFRRFVPIVRWHHERQDGRGFPDGLRGDAIPLEAQVVAIANRFDEIHHDEELSDHDAVARLLDEANGGAFDRALAELFV